MSKLLITFDTNTQEIMNTYSITNSVYPVFENINFHNNNNVNKIACAIVDIENQHWFVISNFNQLNITDNIKLRECVLDAKLYELKEEIKYRFLTYMNEYNIRSEYYKILEFIILNNVNCVNSVILQKEAKKLGQNVDELILLIKNNINQHYNVIVNNEFAEFEIQEILKVSTLEELYNCNINKIVDNYVYKTFEINVFSEIFTMEKRIKSKLMT